MLALTNTVVTLSGLPPLVVSGITSVKPELGSTVHDTSNASVPEPHVNGERASSDEQ